MIHHRFGIRRRFDRAGKKGIFDGYFLWLTVGYAIGKHLIHLVLHYICVDQLDVSALCCVCCGIAYVHGLVTQFSLTVHFSCELHSGPSYLIIWVLAK